MFVKIFLMFFVNYLIFKQKEHLLSHTLSPGWDGWI